MTYKELERYLLDPVGFAQCQTDGMNIGDVWEGAKELLAHHIEETTRLLTYKRAFENLCARIDRDGGHAQEGKTLEENLKRCDLLVANANLATDELKSALACTACEYATFYRPNSDEALCGECAYEATRAGDYRQPLKPGFSAQQLADLEGDAIPFAASPRLMAQPTEPAPLGCAHGRAVGQPCPHCMGINGPSPQIRSMHLRDFAKTAAKPASQPVCTTCGGSETMPGFADGTFPCPTCRSEEALAHSVAVLGTKP